MQTSHKPVILAISGSQRSPSFTEKMLDILIEGMGDVELHKFYPHKMRIGPCMGCFACWTGKNKGECIQRDDFQQILDVYKRCDYLIVAAPVFFFGFPATVKNVIDRFFVNLDATQVEMGDGVTTHPKRVTPNAKGVLVASCGFPDIENFALISAHFKTWMKHGDITWGGEVLIPAAGAANVSKLFNANLEAIRRAGSELRVGIISKETMEAINDTGIAPADYREMVNANFSCGIGGTMKQISIGAKMLREKTKRTKN